MGFAISVQLVASLEVFLWQRADPRFHFCGELLPDVGMFCGEVVRLGGIGAEIEEFEVAPVA